jgi:hypothetical protein
MNSYLDFAKVRMKRLRREKQKCYKAVFVGRYAGQVQLWNVTSEREFVKTAVKSVTRGSRSANGCSAWTCLLLEQEGPSLLNEGHCRLGWSVCSSSVTYKFRVS